MFIVSVLLQKSAAKRPGKDNIMRYQSGLIMAVALALCLTTVFGVVFTDHYPHTVRAESIGFDALAHNLFDGAVGRGAGPHDEAAQ